MWGSLVVYAGLVGLGIGALLLVRPVARFGVPTRRRAIAICGSGLALALIGFVLPAPEQRVASIETRLDEFVPAFQFHERHEIDLAQSPERVFEAVKAVTAKEIWLFQLLTAIRRGGRSGPESILNAPADRPLLDVATRTTFLMLATEPSRELVLGTLVRVPPGFQPPPRPDATWFRELAGPGLAKAVMNFRLQPDGRGGCRLSTETRVWASDPESRRRFAVYWRVIYPGSALIRRMWLHAIARRVPAPG